MKRVLAFSEGKRLDTGLRHSDPYPCLATWMAGDIGGSRCSPCEKMWVKMRLRHSGMTGGAKQKTIAT